jgi:hypothetical protein
MNNELFLNENDVSEYIYKYLKEKINNYNIKIIREGKLNYHINNGYELSHKSDIMLEADNKIFSIEIKFKSAVTDQFKCRSYDIIHLKKEYKNLIGILIYLKHKDYGIIIERARNICYGFDYFIGIEYNSSFNSNKLDQLINIITGQIKKGNIL